MNDKSDKTEGLLSINIEPKRVLYYLLLLVLVFFILNCGDIVYNHFIGQRLFALKLFSFNTEYGIPSFYSGVVILFNGILLALIAFREKLKLSSYLYWLLLSFMMFYLSYDELLSIHERLNQPINNNFHFDGYLYYPWVVPYFGLTIIFFACFLKFLLQLPKPTSVLFIMAGSLFVLGAIGFEVLSAKECTLHSDKTLTYSVLYTCEETFEILGMLIFMYALLDYLKNDIKKIDITISQTR